AQATAAGGPSARRAETPARPRGDGGAVLATPATRKLARDLSVDITTVSGTGSGGRITSDDVRAHAGGGGRVEVSAEAAAAKAARVAAGLDVRLPFRGVRKTIAEHLVKSKRETAHFTYVEEVDCTALVALREKANQRLAKGADPIKLSYLPFIVKATVEGLKKFPQ